MSVAMKMRGACGAAALLLAVCAASGAAAESLSGLPELNIAASNRLDMKLVGHIKDRCIVGGGGNFNFGELRGGEGIETSFSLDCNVPFDIKIRSASGGLAHATMPQGQGPFAGLLAYDLQLTIPTLRPAPDVINGQYTSRELTNTRTLSSGDGIGAGGGTLSLQMHNPDGAGLLAGAYSETLFLTVTPRM